MSVPTEGRAHEEGMLRTLSDWFWWDRLWLPGNVTWSDLQDRDGRVYAKAADLWVTLPLALLFMVVRQIFEISEFLVGVSLVLTAAEIDRSIDRTPLARLLGVKDKTRLKVPPNPVLDWKFYTRPREPKTADVGALCKKAGCSLQQVERWFRRRRNQDRPSLLKKFREASWRFTFYLLAFFAGLAALIDKPWFYNLKDMWKGFPVLVLLPSQYWYYMIELGFYWSLLFSVASDIKRKDFKEQIVHHIATIVLISLSWCVNFIRAGTLIMLVHDASDYFLEVRGRGGARSLEIGPLYKAEWNTKPLFQDHSGLKAGSRRPQVCCIEPPSLPAWCAV
ncbi:ceramide synthase 2-like, partial [Polyodon spathula]|uniref:ceramide synthase 2-like n=1 Tax=Polyodon spathula TaxID=7913 RepID=UPI001B7F1808